MKPKQEWHSSLPGYDTKQYENLGKKSKKKREKERLKHSFAEKMEVPGRKNG